MTEVEAPDLESLGWGPRLHALAAVAGHPGSPSRVVRSDGAFAVVLGAEGRRSVAGHGLVVGDWVLVDGDRVHPLERRTALARKAAGTRSDEQVLAANVDVVVVVEPLDVSPNLRRIERMLALAWSSGATPIVVLTKSDLVEQSHLRAVQDVARGVDVIALSSVTGDGLSVLSDVMRRTDTFVLLGPSGAGKSTLVNTLAGHQVLAVGEVRGDGRGRHTTTHRELVPVPGVGLLIDTPGIRAVGMTADLDGVDRSFDDVVELAARCRFADCTHAAEPGCAVREAVADGVLDERRLDSYQRLQREVAHHAARRVAHDRDEERRDTKGRRTAKRTVMRAKGR